MFEIKARPEPGRLVVSVLGELDIATVALVSRALGKRAPGEDLVLDLSGLTFLDTSAIQLVVEAKRSADEFGYTLTVLRAPPQVHRVFEMVGLEDVLPFASDPAGPPGG